MADEPGRISLGFSVTPDELTVVTDQGNTVTLIDTGVELVDSYRTIVARATNGEKYPIVVNESQSHAAIGANWQHDEGGNPNADGRDYVKIIDDQNAYVNVQLIAWLMQFGANFSATFNDVYIKNGTGHEESGLNNYSCHLGDIMQINSFSGTRQSFIYDDADGHLINCAGNGYSDTTHAADDYKVTRNPSDTDAYNNYWVLKALGVPLSVVPDFTRTPGIYGIFPQLNGSQWNTLVFRYTASGEIIPFRREASPGSSATWICVKGIDSLANITNYYPLRELQQGLLMDAINAVGGFNVTQFINDGEADAELTIDSVNVIQLNV